MRKFCLLFFLTVSLLAHGAKPQPKPLIIRHVLIYDGTGNEPYVGDVQIAGDKITAVERVIPTLTSKADELEGRGLALAPGFIDMHSHAGSGIFKDPAAKVMIRQGVTTALVGQDGDSEYPLADFFAKLAKSPTTINIASMTGQGTLREQVMGKDLLRASTPEELARMKQLLEQEMKSGAFGLSTGLEYDPAHFSTIDELVALSKVAAAHHGFYISHVRDEGNDVFKSFDEILEIGKRANIPVEITHIKLGTTPVWHQAAKLNDYFARAKKEGVDLRADVYPYTYWHSNARVIMLDRDYYNPEKVARALQENGGPSRFHVVHFEPDPSVNDKTLEQIALQWKMTPVQSYVKIIKDTEPRPDGKRPEEDVIVESMSDDDVRWFIANPNIAFCSDGGLFMQHPRSAGTFPRILGHCSRDEKVLPMEAAIHKMTLLPAQRLGLKDRGKIAPGYIADLVLFDPNKIIDRSTIQQWNDAPDGIIAVMVSGKWVVKNNELTGERPGKILRHQ
ncbi:MAG TPA: D-aminoacylase [Terriglobales bacterium]|nr:D-aminoacylase [Terriglobales bacterium]